MLAAMSIAWFERHNLPRPGAVGILCAGAGAPTGAGFGGDADYTTMPLGEGRGAPPPVRTSVRSNSSAGLPYLAGTDPQDSLWDGLFHGFFYNPDVPESRDCYDIITRFFDRHLRR
jgi:epsilon-lactone hydrolase